MSYPENFSSRAFNRYWDRPPAPARSHAERVADVYGRYTVEELRREAVRLALSTMPAEAFNACLAAVEHEIASRQGKE